MFFALSINCLTFCLFLVASAGAVDESDFENAFFECPDVKVCKSWSNCSMYIAIRHVLFLQGAAREFVDPVTSKLPTRLKSKQTNVVNIDRKSF